MVQAQKFYKRYLTKICNCHVQSDLAFSSILRRFKTSFSHAHNMTFWRTKNNKYLPHTPGWAWRGHEGKIYLKWTWLNRHHEVRTEVCIQKRVIFTFMPTKSLFVFSSPVTLWCIGDFTSKSQISKIIQITQEFQFTARKFMFFRDLNWRNFGFFAFPWFCKLNSV